MEQNFQIVTVSYYRHTTSPSLLLLLLLRTIVSFNTIDFPTALFWNNPGHYILILKFTFHIRTTRMSFSSFRTFQWEIFSCISIILPISPQRRPRVLTLNVASKYLVFALKCITTDCGSTFRTCQAQHNSLEIVCFNR